MCKPNLDVIIREDLDVYWWFLYAEGLGPHGLNKKPLLDATFPIHCWQLNIWSVETHKRLEALVRELEVLPPCGYLDEATRLQVLQETLDWLQHLYATLEEFYHFLHVSPFPLQHFACTNDVEEGKFAQYFGNLNFRHFT